MRLFEIKEKLVKNPFTSSKIQTPLYHGTNSKFSKFLRPAHGIYVTPWKEWASTHYGDSVLTIYANVTKMYTMDPGSRESDAFYDMDYKSVAVILDNLSKSGFNCCKFGGESESMVLFNNIQIVDALTGAEM